MLLAHFGLPGLVNEICVSVPGYEDVLGASVAATAVNNPDKLPSSNCTNCQRDFISDKALVMKGCEGGRVLLQGPGVAWLCVWHVATLATGYLREGEGRAMRCHG